MDRVEWGTGKRLRLSKVGLGPGRIVELALEDKSECIEEASFSDVVSGRLNGRFVLGDRRLPIAREQVVVAQREVCVRGQIDQPGFVRDVGDSLLEDLS